MDSLREQTKSVNSTPRDEYKIKIQIFSSELTVALEVMKNIKSILKEKKKKKNILITSWRTV